MSSVAVVKKSTYKEAQEIPVTMGGIEFLLDVSNAELTRDNKGRETLSVMVSVRGIGSNGMPLDIGQEATLYAS